MMFKCEFKDAIILVTHVEDGHEYGFYVRAPGDISMLSQRTRNSRAKSNASLFAEAARIAALEFSSERLILEPHS